MKGELLVIGFLKRTKGPTFFSAQKLKRKSKFKRKIQTRLEAENRKTNINLKTYKIGYNQINQN